MVKRSSSTAVADALLALFDQWSAAILRRDESAIRALLHEPSAKLVERILHNAQKAVTRKWTLKAERVDHSGTRASITFKVFDEKNAVVDEGVVQCIEVGERWLIAEA